MAKIVRKKVAVSAPAKKAAVTPKAKTAQRPGGVKGYVGNVFKEVKDFGKAYKATGEMSNTYGPGTDRKASTLRKKQDAQMGQLLGAVLQGRRYDDKTGKQVKAVPANARQLRKVGEIKPVKKAAAPQYKPIREAGPRWQDSGAPMIKLPAPKPTKKAAPKKK